MVHKRHFENEIIIFQRGIAWMYSIFRKRVGVGMDLMLCQPEEFPVSNVATALATGKFDANTSGQSIGFLDSEIQKYIFRNRLAQQFVNAIWASNLPSTLASFAHLMRSSPSSNSKKNPL